MAVVDQVLASHSALGDDSARVTVLVCRQGKPLGSCKISVAGLELGKTHELEEPLSGVNAGFLVMTVTVTDAVGKSDALRKLVHSHSRPLLRGYVEVRIATPEAHGDTCLSKTTSSSAVDRWMHLWQLRSG